MSSSSSNSISTFSPSEPETPEGNGRLQNFDQSMNHVDLSISIEHSLKNAQKDMHQKRIQNLRKELDYLKSTEWQYECDKGTIERDNEEDEDYLAEQLLNLELSESCKNNLEPIDTDSKKEIPRDAQCFERTGVVTYKDDNYILIDGSLYFELSSSLLQLKLNDKISYLGYKDKNDCIVIVRVLENHGTIWSDEDYEENVEENKFKILEHVIIGEVEDRDKRNVLIKDSDLKFNLDYVEGTFIPIQGDWLELKCKVQWDENKPSDISSNQVLKVISFRPLRKKMITALVTEWCGEEGICDRQIYFNKQCVPNGIVLRPGSKVFVEAIESNQGICTWRALNLLLLNANIPDETNTQISNLEESSFKVEEERKIQVTYPLKFDKVDLNDRATIMLTVTNNSEQPHTINKWVILSRKRDSQIDIAPVLTRPKKLLPNETFCFKVTCIPKFLGSSKENLIIMFRGFQIKRFIEINVITKYSININSKKNRMSALEQIDSMRQIRKNNFNSFVPGVRILKKPAFIPVKLGIFQIPDKIWNAVLGDSSQTIHSLDYELLLRRIETSIPCLTQNLNINNYTDKWHTFLFLEEIQQNIFMRMYDMSSVFLIRCQDYLGVEIDGLSEKRPSIVKGDQAIVRDVWDENSPNYEGFVHDIRGDLVLMKFHQRFHESYSGSDVSIEFHFSRTVFRRSHQAINLAISNLGVELLFPTRVLSRPSQFPKENLQSIKWFNNKLNVEQKAAVTNILLGEARTLPYCIFGPPGTGKTVTVIETILQILTMIPDSRILVATPSNSAANLITERLIEFRNVFSDSMIRLIAFYLVDSENIPDAIKPYCATLDIAKEHTTKSRHTFRDGINLNCQTSYIGRHRVTIGTCYCLGTLAQMGLPKGHFTHIIVDEAGQATEPEIMIPMTFTDKENGQIILAGDPMQLGPVIISRYNLEFGMDESYLSRILTTFPYQKDFTSYENGFNSKLVTKLNDNYRSVQEVIKLPSEMFYDGSLVEKFNRNQPWVGKVLNAVSDIFGMSDRKSGGIFVFGIRGCNARAEDSPSWFNPQEASMVAMTACKLYKRNITPDEIGIITPYIAQIKHIRLLFDAIGLPEPKIGTVEEFQGQERPLIIISIVRSSDAYLLEDTKNLLGFVKNPKRLNVVLTRAQVAVLLFCDPYLLTTDPLWKKVIKTAVEEDKYMGCDLPSDL